MNKQCKRPLKVQPADTPAAILQASGLSRTAPPGVRAPLTEKGVETMMGVNAHTHVALTEMADQKANIMITTHSIVLSLLVG